MATRTPSRYIPLALATFATAAAVLIGAPHAAPTEEAPDPIAAFAGTYAEQVRQPVLLADARALDEMAARLALLTRDAPLDPGPVLALLPNEPDTRALAFSGRVGLRDVLLLREGLALGALLPAATADGDARARLLAWVDDKQGTLSALAPDVRAPLAQVVASAKAGRADPRGLVRALYAALGDIGTESRANAWFVSGVWASLARLHAAQNQPSAPMAMLGEALADALEGPPRADRQNAQSRTDDRLAKQLDIIAAELRKPAPSLQTIDAALPRLTAILPEVTDDAPAGLRHFRRTDDCKALSKMPTAPAGEPAVQAARAAWARVSTVFSNLVRGFTARVVFLSPEARVLDLVGKPHPLAPIAMTCVDQRLVYIPHPLVERVYDANWTPTVGEQRYPADFFAFIVAHELAHIVAEHHGADEASRGFAGRYGDEEVLADRRAAFYSQLAGYSPAAVWRDDLVRVLLMWDHSTSGTRTDHGAVNARHRALRKELGHFSAYEDAFQAARMLDFAGERDEALALLTWLDEGAFKVPEVNLSRAMLLIRRAAPDAPWAEVFDPLGEGRQHVPCITFDPLHTGLHDPARDRLAGMGSDERRAQARADLRLAGELLEAAAGAGADPFAVAAARACISAYQGRPDSVLDAQKQQALAERLAPKGAGDDLRAALGHNRALVEWVAFLAENPLPPVDNTVALGGWAEHLAEHASRFEANPGVARLARGLSRLPDALRLRGMRPVVEVLACKKGQAASTVPPAALELPERAAGADPCPAGWRWRRSVPAHAADESGPLDGVTTCLPEGGRGEADRLVFVALPGVAARVRLQRVAGERPAAGLQRWACVGKLERVGMSNLGWAAWRLRRERAEVVVADEARRVRARAVVQADMEAR